MQILVAQHFVSGVIERALELQPCLAHHLFTRALHGRASVRPRLRPVGDIDREDAVHVAVSEQLGRHVAPELELRDARERPFGVDVNHMPVRRRHRAVQIELHAVHPLQVHGQRAQVGKRRVGCRQAAVHHGGHVLERQRCQIMVATHHGALPLLARDDAGDASELAQDFLDLRVPDVLHAAGFQIARATDPSIRGSSARRAHGRSIPRSD